MVFIIRLLTVAAWVLACYFMLVRIENGHCKKDVIIKSAVSVCIVLIGLFANLQWLTTFMRVPPKSEVALHYLVFFGLVFYALGDLRLGQAHISRDNLVAYRKEGIICFGLGHVVMAIAMISLFDKAYIKYIILAFAVAIAMGLASGFGARKLKLHFGRYTVMVAVYIGVLVLNAALAWGLKHSMEVAFDTATAEYQALIATAEYQEAIALDPTAVAVVPVMSLAYGSVKNLALGFLAFMISDLSLAPMYFGKVGNKPHYVIFNHVTYYLAQLLIAYSLIAF